MCGETARSRVSPSWGLGLSRVCGETTSLQSSSAMAAGLSPRVRGNPGVYADGVYGLRSIPACAGKPWLPPVSTCRLRVYPRVCGETEVSSFCTTPNLGLSPRVRGNHHPADGHLDTDGSIPACAGKPHAWSWEASWPTVYPRVCGETRCCRRSLAASRGLSPRVRGNRLPVVVGFGSTRSIPACAGKPCTNEGGGFGHDGSIPACAGKPEPRSRCWALYSVYPRVCGETECQARCQAPARGLSPRVRGNHRRPWHEPAGLRSIPACAGKPCPRRSAPQMRQVYPRVCGETTGGRFCPLPS